LNYLLLVAVQDDCVVGYKIEYQDRKSRFYSWLGGVYPEYRSQGIASELMFKQHEWCKEQRYTVIRTQTKNKFRNMLILNLSHGFDIVGTYTDEKGEPKIILEKRL
jgi:predicted GNAT superfamily acetyltransferase